MENAVCETVIFDQIKNKGRKFGRDFWWARDIANALDYNWWQFEKLINDALYDCRTDKVDAKNHFVEVSKTGATSYGATGNYRDVAMSKYFTHRIVENADGEKDIVQLAQAYFGSAERIKDEEINEKSKNRSAEKKQLTLREAVVNYNKWLSSKAKAVGVRSSSEYMDFNKAGIMGLYGGLKPVDIRDAMDLPVNAVMYDYMGVPELEANKRRILIAGSRLDCLRRFSGARTANNEHEAAGRQVRGGIESAGETVPENLKMAKKSVQQIKKEFKTAERELKTL